MEKLRSRWSPDFLEGRSWRLVAAGTLGATALIGLLDYATGPEISSIVFYLPPVATAAWYKGRSLGGIVAIVATAVWLMSDYATGHAYSHQAIQLWNAGVRMLVFLLVAHLFARLRLQLDSERDLAKTDPVTGVLNTRGLYSQLEAERYRAVRYHRPLSLAYLDLDNFKGINDALGHDTGDQVLRRVASLVRGRVRQADLVARIGGDEFAVVFVEAGGQDATTALRKVQERLTVGMREAGWPVTVSAGLITFDSAPPSVREMIRLADELMYSVKRGGKDGFVQRTWRAAPEEAIAPQ